MFQTLWETVCQPNPGRFRPHSLPWMLHVVPVDTVGLSRGLWTRQRSSAGAPGGPFTPCCPAQWAVEAAGASARAGSSRTMRRNHPWAMLVRYFLNARSLVSLRI